MSHQDPLATPEHRREAIISTLAAALHRWHRDQIRAGARARRAASMPATPHQQPESSRLDCAEDDRPDRPLPTDTAARHVAGGNDGDQSWR